MRTFIYNVPQDQTPEQFVVVAKNRKDADTTMAQINPKSTYTSISVESFEQILQGCKNTSANDMTVVLVTNGRIEKRIHTQT